MKYYYLAASLPEIRFGVDLKVDFEELRELLKINLTSKDWEQVCLFLQFFDLENIRALWKYSKIENPFGNLDAIELEEAIVNLSSLRDYITEFFDHYPTVEMRLSHFPELIQKYYDFAIEHSSGFLRKLFEFERDLRLIFAAFRAKKMGRDIVFELQFESEENDLVQQIINQKDAKEYIPPEEYSELKAIFQDQPLEMLKALCEYRFRKIEELLEGDAFSSDRILGYLAEWLIVHQWNRLDKQEGESIMNRIISGAAS